MTTLREAAQQALEALEYHVEQTRPIWKTSEAITALRAALAEPPTNQCGETCERAKLCAVCARGLAEPAQEPVGKVELMMTGGNAGLATRIVEIDDHLRDRLRPGQLIYTAQPQRKPLTEEEISSIWDGHIVPVFGKNGINPVVFARAIERAHGIGGKDE